MKNKKSNFVFDLLILFQLMKMGKIKRRNRRTFWLLLHYAHDNIAWTLAWHSLGHILCSDKIILVIK